MSYFSDYSSDDDSTSLTGDFSSSVLISSSTTTTYLSGPPEVYKSSNSGLPTNTGDQFSDLINANFNSTSPTRRKGFTQNFSRTYLTSGNPCLDFFFHVVPSTDAVTLKNYLEKAWTRDPLTTLKLICNLRGVRGKGKANKEGYYTAALWLHNFHPKTLACNVGAMADFGYFKDLPEILHRLLQTSDWLEQKAEHELLKASAEKSLRGGGRGRGRGGGRLRVRGGGRVRSIVRRVRPFRYTASAIRLAVHNYSRYSYDLPEEDGTKRPFSLDGNKRKRSREARILAESKRVEIEKEKASKLREERKVALAKKAVSRYERDPEYRILYERISDFFADCLRNDIQLLESGKLKGLSLAAKWCPSLDSSFDKSTLLCESIARKIFPKESYPEYEGIDDAYYAYRVRDRLRKQVLVPLRKALQLPEVYIGANQWGFLPYNRVASVAMTFYKEKFLKHDRLRFEDYLEKVKSGKATIAAGALLPHKIIASLNDGDLGEVAELQWKRIVDDMSSKGKLKNCIAVCDVSSSMEGIPMEVSLALGVLVSELSEEPWSGKLITFSTKPKLQQVQGEDLRSKVDFVRNMEVESNTDFQMVFDVILKVAVKANLKEDQMIKKIFVFSDMEFDQVSENVWETDYQAITRKFTEKGYGSCVPEIVFWNLRDSKATPVPGDKPGVALVSGYSKNLMTLFLEDNGTLNPESVMGAAIAGEEYSKLVVLD